MQLSVIICCHNSSLLITETIEHLRLQVDLHGILWEVVVVNNGSVDETKDLLIELQRTWPLKEVPFRIISEPQVGLSNARLCGIRNTTSRFVVFCDDDNSLNSKYLITAYQYMRANPMVGILGGVGVANLTGPEPDWWPQFSKSYALGPQSEESGEVSLKRSYVYGAGMVVRREVLNMIEDNKFNTLLQDRSGKELTSGGDVELCFLAKYFGYQIHYCKELTFIHRLSTNRITWLYYKQLKLGISKSYNVLMVYKYFLRPDLNRQGFLYYYLKELNKLMRMIWFNKEPDRYKREIELLVAKVSLSQSMNIIRLIKLYYIIGGRYRKATLQWPNPMVPLHRDSCALSKHG